MSNEITRTAENFIIDLTGADATKIEENVSEFRLNQRFRHSIEEKRTIFHQTQRFSYGIGATLGMVLYIICRRQKPDIVIETGVASGVSSSHILCALEQNEHGQLYSIDLPGWQENQSGWLIPDYLRHRWHLIEGKSSEKLTPLLKKVTQIDIFLHDSDHSYQNMLREFRAAWLYLKVGGLILAHNIDYSKAFSDFSRSQGLKGHFLDDFGGILKA
jgi:predicted O-methyltransferase YrrM